MKGIFVKCSEMVREKILMMRRKKMFGEQIKRSKFV